MSWILAIVFGRVRASFLNLDGGVYHGVTLYHGEEGFAGDGHVAVDGVVPLYILHGCRFFYNCKISLHILQVLVSRGLAGVSKAIVKFFYMCAFHLVLLALLGP